MCTIGLIGGGVDLSEVQKGGSGSSLSSAAAVKAEAVKVRDWIVERLEEQERLVVQSIPSQAFKSQPHDFKHVRCGFILKPCSKVQNVTFSGNRVLPKSTLCMNSSWFNTSEVSHKKAH